MGQQISPRQPKLPWQPSKLPKHTDEFHRLRALTLIQQALHRLDRNGDQYVDRKEWERMKQIFDTSIWEHKALDDMWVKLDRWGKKKLEYEVFADFLLHGEEDVTKLVKDIVFTPPHGTEGFNGIFGPRLLAASTSVDFQLRTEDALADVDIIGILFQTVTTIDRQSYPPALSEEVKEQRAELTKFRSCVRRETDNYEMYPKFPKNFEVVVCSFDTTEAGYMKTVGAPPWLVMPYEDSWERDYLWRKYNHLLRVPTDPALILIRKDGSVIKKDGLEDVIFREHVWEKNFQQWINMLDPPPKEEKPKEEKEEAAEEEA